MDTLIPSDPSQADPRVVALLHGMMSSEGTIGNPEAIGDQGTAAGVGQWSNQINGKPQKLAKGQIPVNFENDAKQYGLNPSDFSLENQKKVLYGEIASGKQQGLTPEQILSKHNSGDPNKYLNAATSSGTGPVGSYNVASYVSKAMAAAQSYARKSGGTGAQTSYPAPGATQQSQQNVSGYAPPTPPQAPQAPEQQQPGDSSSPGFLQGLSEDLSGTNPESIGTQLANTVKGAGNLLFPILGDVGNDITGKNKKSALQQGGDLGLSVLPFLPGIGELGEGARGAEIAADAAKSTGLLGKIAGSATAKGLGAGYGAGVLSNLSNGQGVVQSLTPNSTNVESALTGGVAGAVLPRAAGLLGKTGGVADADVQRAIQDAMPLENKATRIDALRDSLPGSPKGGVVRKGILGTSSIVPNEEDVARGTAAAPYISGTGDPVVKIQKLNQGIQNVSKETDNFLDANSAPANFADMRDYMETNKPNSNLQKDPGASEAYNRATQDALDTLYSTMKGSANETGNFGADTSAADIRKARIAIDQQISKELGENTFGTPQYKGIKAAEIDTRNLLNRMSEDMLRYPGQLDKLNKMNEFVSSAKGRGIEVNLDDPEVRSQLEKTFGLTATPEAESNAQKLADAHKNMSYLYQSRDNLIDKYQRKIGKNKIQEAVDSNPVVKAVAGIATKAVPFGLADHLTK